MATLNFDNAMEMFLYALIDYTGAKVEGDGLINLIKALKTGPSTKKQSATINEIEIRSVHQARNQIQHHGTTPNISDVERFRDVTYEILSSLSQEILGINFEEILLSELIKDVFSRNFYRLAERAYSQQDYRNALLYSAVAFEYAKRLEQQRIWGSGLLFSIMKSKDKLNDLDEVLIAEIEILKLRLDYKKYQKYRDVFGHSLGPFTSIESQNQEGIIEDVKAMIQESMNDWSNKGIDELKSDAMFCLSFVLDSILMWESIPRKGWSS
jgi:hypothetical protein